VPVIAGAVVSPEGGGDGGVTTPALTLKEITKLVRLALEVVSEHLTYLV